VYKKVEYAEKTHLRKIWSSGKKFSSKTGNNRKLEKLHN
jgi:hypothetical protein